MTWPYKMDSLRPEQQMLIDQHSLLTKADPEVGPFHHRHWRSAIMHPSGGSMNFTLAGVAIALGLDPESPRFSEALASMDKHGHMQAELGSINYGDLLLLHAAAAAHHTPATHDAHRLLERHLVLMAILARPIREKRYAGMGWRPAGLRSTANNWGAWYDSLLFSQLTDQDWRRTKKNRRDDEWFEMARALNIPQSTTALAKIVVGCGPGRRGSREILHLYSGEIDQVLAPVKSPPGMEFFMARNVETDETWMHMTGTRFGGNTGATWASHAVNARTTHRAYCWRRFGRPIPRVRPAYKKGKKNFFEAPGPAKGELVKVPDGGMVLKVSAGKWEDRLRVPEWVWGPPALVARITRAGTAVSVPQ